MVQRAQAAGRDTEADALAEELTEVSKRARDWRHYTLGLYRLNRAAEAIPTLEQELKERPDDTDLLEAMAWARQECGEPAKALHLLDKILEAQPRSDGLWFHKGQVLTQMDRHDDAFEAFSVASRLDPGDPIPKLHAARALLRLKKPKQAKQLLQELLPHAERCPDILVLYGSALIEDGQPEEAVKLLTEATRFAPRDHVAWEGLGEALLKLKRYDEASKALEQALELHPDCRWALVCYCKALFALGAHKKALQRCPADMVTHRVFHELLDLYHRGPTADALRVELSHWESMTERSMLSAAIVEFVSHASKHADASDVPWLKLWRDALAEQFGSQTEYELVIKVFDVLARYKESRDERVLLELPLEQRALLAADQEKLRSGRGA